MTVGAQQALYLIGQLLAGRGGGSRWRSPATRTYAIFAMTGKPVAATGRRAGHAPDAGRYRGRSWRSSAGRGGGDAIAPLPERVRMSSERQRAAVVGNRRGQSDCRRRLRTAARIGHEACPALKSIDMNGRVFYVGSLSKTLAGLGRLVARRARQLRRCGACAA